MNTAQPAGNEKLDDLLDRLVAEYQDRVAAGAEPRVDDVLARAPVAHRAALERSLRMIQAGTASAPRASRVLVPGVTLGAYRLVREIGRGGMAIVFHATQIDLRRSVALKVLRPGLAVEKSHVERFQREALAIARLQHPHIVQVHAVGETDGWHWIAMEYVEGRNLAQIYVEMARVERDPSRWTAEILCAAGGIPSAPFANLGYPQALAKLLAPVARAIGVAHEIGLVHRDVKPSNILVHKDGRALVADFGLAKGDGDPALSMSGEPVGTPYYMSPEQALLARTPVDRRTDVYSLGVTLYEGIAGRRPFEGTSTFAVLDAIRVHNPEPLMRYVPKISRDMDAVVEVAMAKEPGVARLVGVTSSDRSEHADVSRAVLRGDAQDLVASSGRVSSILMDSSVPPCSARADSPILGSIRVLVARADGTPLGEHPVGETGLVELELASGEYVARKKGSDVTAPLRVGAEPMTVFVR